MNWASLQVTGSPSAKVTLWAIANYANPASWCAFPSQERLSEQTEQSADSVQRRIPELEEKGLLRRLPLRYAGRRSVDFFILQPSPHFHAALADIEPLLPRGFTVDPRFAKSAAADGGNAVTLPQTLPQSAPDATALVRQQEPLREPSEPEREGAREGAKEAEAESRRLWATLKADYLGAAKDNLGEAERLFFARTLPAQRKSVESLPAWNAYIGPNPRRRVMLQDYVRDARWDLIPAEVKATAAKSATPETVFLDAFSREWWWLFGRTPAGQFLRKRIDMARNMAIGWPVPADKVAGIKAAAERDLVGVKVDTAHFRAWQAHYSSIGVDLPIPDKVEWVFLPTHGPPDMGKPISEQKQQLEREGAG